jgi:acyl dehydratase
MNTSNFIITGSLIEKGPIIGTTAQLIHSFNPNSVSLFASICGDNNPIHLDPEFAKKTIFGRPIIHGMLVSSLFSTLFGRSINSAIYVSQQLQFKAPVYVGSPVTAKIEVIKCDEKKKGFLITCITTCTLEDNTVAVSGEACVLIPTDTYKNLTKNKTE